MLYSGKGCLILSIYASLLLPPKKCDDPFLTKQEEVGAGGVGVGVGGGKGANSLGISRDNSSEEKRLKRTLFNQVPSK